MKSSADSGSVFGVRRPLPISRVRRVSIFLVLRLSTANGVNYTAVGRFWKIWFDTEHLGSNRTQRIRSQIVTYSSLIQKEPSGFNTIPSESTGILFPPGPAYPKPSPRSKALIFAAFEKSDRLRPTSVCSHRQIRKSGKAQMTASISIKACAWGAIRAKEAAVIKLEFYSENSHSEIHETCSSSSGRVFYGCKDTQRKLLHT
jgi:hypothetical protein